MARNALGEFEFVSWHRTDDPAAPPLLVTEANEIVHRPGINGTALIKLGLKGQAFTMRSAVDVAGDRIDVLRLLQQYQQTIAQRTYELVWQGIDFRGEFDTVYLVTDCRPTKCQHVTVAVGGLSGDPNYWVEATWTLIAVASEEAA
jgi:hypothetical protein